MTHKLIEKKWLSILNILEYPVRLPLSIIRGLKHAKQPSYYPELERKSYMRRLLDNIKWSAKNLEANDYYCLYGLDIKGAKQSDYLAYKSFFNSRNKDNNVGSDYSQIYLLRDKFAFYKYMKSFCLQVPEVFALYKNGHLYNKDLTEISFNEIAKEKDYFIKSIDGECADFIRRVKDYEMLLEVKKEFKNDEAYIFQEKIVQSKEMNLINPQCINTYRIVTIYNNGDPYVFSQGLRIGTSETGNVDNWAAGGLFVGINNGKLKKYGFFKPSHGLKAEIHPDTGIVFEGYKAPYFREACDLVIEAHKKFYSIKSIGWDIAISESGPVIIEGNDNWEINLMQAVDGPLRKNWEDIISNEC